MKIVDAKVLVTSPGRNFVTLKLTTDEGLTGLGDATLNGRELAVVSYLEDHVVPLLLGLDPHRIEDTWQSLYRGAYWRRGPVTMAAIAAVDVALWDIKAKAAGLPLYQLLGGASRDRVGTYGHANGRDIPELLDSVRARLAEGYPAVRVQSGIPGLKAVYGVSSTADDGSPVLHQQARPLVEDWDTDAYLRHMPDVLEAVRAEFGPELPLLHDAHHRLTPVQAARLGKELEPYHLFWLEDCTPAENQEALRTVRRHTTTPLAVGEVFNTVYDYQGLITEQLIDYVRSAVTHFGGVTPCASSSTSRRSTRSRARYTVRRTSPRWAWRPLSTSTSPYTTSGSRSTRATPRSPRRSSATPTRSRTDTCTRARRRGSVWTSTRNWRPRTPTRRPTSRSTGCTTGRSTTGDPPRCGARPAASVPRTPPAPPATGAHEGRREDGPLRHVRGGIRCRRTSVSRASATWAVMYVRYG